MMIMILTEVNKQHLDQSNIDDLAPKLLILAIIYFMYKIEFHYSFTFFFSSSFFWFVSLVIVT